MEVEAIGIIMIPTMNMLLRAKSMCYDDIIVDVGVKTYMAAINRNGQRGIHYHKTLAILPCECCCTYIFFELFLKYILKLCRNIFSLNARVLLDHLNFKDPIQYKENTM